MCMHIYIIDLKYFFDKSTGSKANRFEPVRTAGRRRRRRSPPAAAAAQTDRQTDRQTDTNIASKNDTKIARKMMQISFKK